MTDLGPEIKPHGKAHELLGVAARVWRANWKVFLGVGGLGGAMLLAGSVLLIKGPKTAAPPRAPAPAAPAEPLAAARDAIKAQYDAAAKGMLAKDVKAMFAVTTPDYVFKPLEGKPQNRSEAMAENQKQLAMTVSVASFAFVIESAEISPAGDVATVLNVQKFSGTVKDPKKGPVPIVNESRCKDTWAKSPEGWRLRQSEELAMNQAAKPAAAEEKPAAPPKPPVAAAAKPPVAPAKPPVAPAKPPVVPAKPPVAPAAKPAVPAPAPAPAKPVVAAPKIIAKPEPAPPAEPPPAPKKPKMHVDTQAVMYNCSTEIGLLCNEFQEKPWSAVKCLRQHQDSLMPACQRSLQPVEDGD